MRTPEIVTGSVPALEGALADAIRQAKASDPLAPVTVLVGGTLMRPYLQRRLATLLGGHANITITTPGELALRLGEPAMIASGAKPMPPLAARILAGEIARETHGYFEPVAHTTGFTAALHRLLRELMQAEINPEAFATAAEALPGSAHKHRALAELYNGYEQKRSGWYGVDECARAADPARLDAQLLVLHGVWDLTSSLQTVLSRISAEVPTLLLLPDAPSGAGRALDGIRAWGAVNGATERLLPPASSPASMLASVQRHLLCSPLRDDPPTLDESVRLVSAPDPTREVRAAARACLDWAAAGVPFHSMAIASRNADAYRPLVDSVFREAGIPVYLHEGTPISELPLGRRILTLLDLIDADLERRSVIDFLSEAQLPKATKERYRGFSVTRWDTLSRTAGIVRGREQWRHRLEQQLADRRAQLDGEGDTPADWLTDEVQRIDSLLRFVVDLNGRLEGRRERASFGVHLAHLADLLETYVDDSARVLTGIRSLDRLDGITPELSFDRFRDIVRSAIEGMRADDVLDRRAGAFGRRGVNVLDVNSLRHLRFEGVILLGFVERAWPAPTRQDPLLLDRERQALGDALGVPFPLRVLGPDIEPLQLRTAVEAADRFLQASYPRADRAGGRAQLPSSFLRAIAAAATGRVVTAEDFDHLPIVRRERAAQAGAPRHERALSIEERRRGLLEDEVTTGLGRALLMRDQRFARAAEVDAARVSSQLTPFDGALEAAGVEALRDNWALTRPMAPTALETYARCGMQFFLGRVLNVREIEEPEAVLTIGPLTKGKVVHATLERFLSELGDSDWPQPERRNEHLPRLHEIVREEFAEVESQGLTGYPLLWRHEQQRMEDDLERWYDAEATRGRDLPHRSYELRVGPRRRHEEDANPHSTDEPLTIRAGDAELRFQGRIDRVEWDTATGRFRVIDYKTGRPHQKAAEVSGGQAMQLPLYVRQAAHALGLDPADGEAEYFYVTRDGSFERRAFSREQLAEQREWIDEVLATLIGSMAGGVFPMRPPSTRDCDWCAFDSLCDGRRRTQIARKAQDERVANLDALREGPK